jgi:hypothetical protein
VNCAGLTNIYLIHGNMENCSSLMCDVLQFGKRVELLEAPATSIFKTYRPRINVDMADYSEMLIDLSINESVRCHTPDDCSYAIVQSSFVS